jgi:hypothetical protein
MYRTPQRANKRLPKFGGPSGFLRVPGERAAAMLMPHPLWRLYASLRTLLLFGALAGALVRRGLWRQRGIRRSESRAANVDRNGRIVDGQARLSGASLYPSTITVDAGDTVTWTSPLGRAHTFSFPAPGATLAPLRPTRSPRVPRLQRRDISTPHRKQGVRSCRISTCPRNNAYQ